METRLNRLDCLTKSAVTDMILRLETIIKHIVLHYKETSMYCIIRKPGLTERHVIALVVGTCLKSPRGVINHTPKKLFIIKCLESNALTFLENRQIITWSTLICQNFEAMLSLI